MAASDHTAMRLLLLLSLITTGANGEDGLIFAGRAYDITFPCDRDVCFHIWQLSTSQSSDYVAIVSNGEIQTAPSEDEDSKCTLQIKDLTAEDVGRHRCQQRPEIFISDNTPAAMPELNLMPGTTVSLQCVLLSYMEDGLCSTAQVSLMWVDESGTEIQEDSQHQIKQASACATTLTVTIKTPENKKFRCQATVGEEVQRSVELRVRVQARKGRGRGLLVELEPENRGRNQDAIGAAVGVAGCVVLAMVALFVVNKRRADSQRLDETCYTISKNDVVNTADVIYADIILPAGHDRVWVRECEATEYACVRY
ncbi:uncharacterized protein LOC121955823 [Plectropomus leopardus]|uniref:uncharacterized protein LOC121955823 n=1 Tax=Plectropomus leopardus TaxID=160734 RepID=UPI001C4BA389|nr:uncharacterized protein LOC121955823 [Plectropomus leopardus]